MSCGWGVVPVAARLGGTTWSTSLRPKNSGYLVPLRRSVQRAEGVGVGVDEAVTLRFDVRA